MEPREMMEACCRIRSSGTGFLIAPHRVGTCFHAVSDLEEGAEVNLAFYGRQTRVGRLLAVDKDDDVAVIGIDPLAGVTPLPLTDAYDGREEWEGCGCPDLAGGNLVPLRGKVTTPQGQYGGRP